MFNNKPILLFVLDRNSMSIGGDAFETPQRYEIPNTMYFDLEVTNSTALVAFIETILSKIKMVGNQYAIVFHNSIAFEKTLPKDTKDIHEASESFLDLIPLEKRMSKVVKHGNDMLVSCVNLEIYELIQRVMLKKNCVCKYVITSTSLDPKVPALPLTAQVVNYLSKNVTNLHNMTLVKGELA